jgi:hypothetical protein
MRVEKERILARAYSGGTTFCFPNAPGAYCGLQKVGPAARNTTTSFGEQSK